MQRTVSLSKKQVIIICHLVLDIVQGEPKANNTCRYASYLHK